MLIKIKSGKYPGALILLLIISLVVLIFLDPWSPESKRERQILLKDPAVVDQIRITGSNGSVELFRSGESWLLPGGEEARPRSVENLLFAAGRLQVDAVQTDLSGWEDGQEKKVSFFSRNKPVLQYACISNDGRLILRPFGSEKLYAVSLPAYPDLELGQVFSDSENHYLDHVLIHLLPKDIRKIEIEKRGSPLFIFVRDTSDELRCILPRSDSLVPMERLDEQAIRMLFTYFTSIVYEKKAGEQENLSPEEEADDRWLASIAVESVEGQKHELKVYSLPGENGESAHMFKALVFHNMHPEPLLVKYIYLDVLMRDLPAYFGDNSLRH